ncbi:response regulator [Paenibacillus aestuarii]|uniref:Response regulator n=1 Tax=Paenibacillus aestuarii TaxID=516965 RepID=A0ABW0K7V5_9BACL
MYKVIIVDDEIEIREGLRTVFPWNELGQFEVHTAGDADSAMILVREIQPDIIITDIKMSGMSGLEMISELKEKKLFHGKAIIISGFDDFAYIRTAMQNGAVDYILKPINIEELKRNVIKLMNQISDENTLNLNYKLLENNMNKALPQMREETMRELIRESYSPVLEGIISPQLTYLQLQWILSGKYTLFVVEVDDLKAYKQSDLILFAIGNVMEQTLQEECIQKFAIFRDRYEHWVVIIPEASLPSSEQAKELLSTIILRINTYVKVNATIGHYNKFVDVKWVYEAYCEAISYLSSKTLYGGNRLFTSDDRSACEHAEMKLDDVNELLELVQFGTAEEICAELNGYTGLVQSWSLFAIHDIQERTFEWLLKLLNLCADRGLRDRWWEKEIIQIWEELEKYDTLCSLQKVLEKYLLRLSGTIQQQFPAISQVVREAEQYLQKHYRENLSLQLVASQVHVTPVWLSKLFKKEKQVTFVDYLTQLRMEKAKELLGDTTLRVYQIANEVGYGDRVHFAKTFKKVVGKTPKDFRNLMGIYHE